MICIIILNQRSYLSCYPTSNLHKTDFIASTEVDATDFISTANPEIFNGNEQTHWQLNSSQLQLIAPDNKAIPLSNNECCILRAVINANKNLVSRKTLIEALGQEYWQYDERRLESLISRLRRKLASYAPEGFPIQGVKGRGYLFKARLQEIET